MKRLIACVLGATTLLGCNAFSDFPEAPTSSSADMSTFPDAAPSDIGEPADLDLPTDSEFPPSDMRLEDDTGVDSGAPDVSIPTLPDSFSDPDVLVLGDITTASRPSSAGLPYLSSAWLGAPGEAKFVFGNTNESTLTAVHRLSVFDQMGEVAESALQIDRFAFTLPGSSRARGIRMARGSNGNVFAAILSNSCESIPPFRVMAGELSLQSPLEDPLDQMVGDCQSAMDVNLMGATAGGTNIFDSSVRPVQLTWWDQTREAFTTIEDAKPSSMLRSAFQPKTITFSRNTQSTSGKLIFFVDDAIYYWDAFQSAQPRGLNPVPNQNVPRKLSSPRFGPRHGRWSAAHLTGGIYAIAALDTSNDARVRVQLWKDNAGELQKDGLEAVVDFGNSLNEITLAPFPGGLAIWGMQADAAAIGRQTLVLLRHKPGEATRFLELQRTDSNLMDSDSASGITMRFLRSGNNLVAGGAIQLLPASEIEVVFYQWKDVF